MTGIDKALPVTALFSGCGKRFAAATLTKEAGLFF